MCGISGIYLKDGAIVDSNIVEKMAVSLNHRGPDYRGIHVDGSLGLGHTRLSIIDLSEQGNQPMHSPDGRYTIVYNGEVYNFGEIRSILSAKGHRYRGHSDTEVVLHALMEWGTEAFARFEGMYAIAVWDNHEQRMHLARDRFGIKPLYYYDTAKEMIFGSEIKAILASGRVQARINWVGMHEYMHYDTALNSNTMFMGIHKVLPGHLLTLDASGTKVEPYMSLFRTTPAEDDLHTATDTVRDMLERATKNHLVSDVPVGVFLSGGIDSSAITALASQHYSGQLKTFSVGFDFDKGVNELPQARIVAERFNTDHQEMHLSGGKLTEVIPRLIRCYDEPFSDPASIALYLLSEQVAGDPKVILMGDGGDEIFAGYTRYTIGEYEKLKHLIARASPFIPRQNIWYRRFKAVKAFYHAEPSLRMAMMMSGNNWSAPFSPVFTPWANSLLDASDPFQYYRELYERYKHLDQIQRMLYTDCSIILPDLYFKKVDRATMAHGIEARVPMVDTRMAEYVMALPSAYKIKGREKKFILRQALRETLPAAILDHPKTGFSVPIPFWLQTSLADYLRSTLFDSRLLNDGLLDKLILDHYIQEHLGGRRNNGRLLYRLLNLALWYEEYQVES